MRVQTLPPVHLTVGNEVCRFLRRTRGTLTGTRTAVVAGRVPLLDVAKERQHVWEQLCIWYSGRAMAVSSFVDNVYTCAHSVENAVAVLEDLELFLRERWRLTFGADSRKVLMANGYDTRGLDISLLARWQVATCSNCLGHWLQSDGGIAYDLKDTKAKMWRAFYANLGRGLRATSIKRKMSFLETCVRPIAAYRWSRWPFGRSAAAALDKTQVHMVSCLVAVEPRPHENASDYWRRRSLNAGRLIASKGRWSQHWAKSIRTWAAHIERRHDEGTWNLEIFQHHDENWLNSQREIHEGASITSRTRTRAVHGKVQRRWQEGVGEARFVLPP